MEIIALQLKIIIYILLFFILQLRDRFKDNNIFILHALSSYFHILQFSAIAVSRKCKLSLTVVAYL